MSRRPAVFRQSDLGRAIRALVAEGVDIARVRVEVTRAGAVVSVGSEGGASDTTLEKPEQITL
jgi:hypothetical protein